LTSILTENVKNSLSETDRKVFEFLLLGYNTVEIGSLMNLSGTRIRQIRERIRDKILVKTGRYKERKI